MGTYRTYFSDTFISDTIGRITGSATISRFPNVPGSLFRLQSHSLNVDSFYIGFNSGSGQQLWELEASYDSGWFTLSTHNLNQLFFLNASGSTQILSYWVQN